MVSGEPMPQLEKDPLLDKEADLATDMRGLSGYIKRSKTIIGDMKDRVKISKKCDVLVHRFIENLKKNKDKKKAERARDEKIENELDAEF